MTAPTRRRAALRLATVVAGSVLAPAGLRAGDATRLRVAVRYDAALGQGPFDGRLLLLVSTAAISYMIPRVGVAASIVTVVAGQLLVGISLDHLAC